MKCLIGGLEAGRGGECAQVRVSERMMEEGVRIVPSSLRELPQESPLRSLLPREVRVDSWGAGIIARMGG